MKEINFFIVHDGDFDHVNMVPDRLLIFDTAQKNGEC